MEKKNLKEFYGARHVSGAASMSSTVNPTSQPGTPSTESNSYGDEIRPGANPFTSPSISRPPSSFGGSSALGRRPEGHGQRYFHSRRVKKGEVEKPWLDKKDPKEKWVTIIPVLGIVLGLAISGFLIWDGLHSVVKHNYCLVLQDDFSGGFNDQVWTKEVQVGGFG